jgi:hypothetical protein
MFYSGDWNLTGEPSMRRTILMIGFSLAILSLSTGCGGGVQKGKNQDYDRPKSAPTATTK